MLAVYKKTDIVVDVEPFYLYGRIVAYVGKLYETIPYGGAMVKCIGSGNVITEKYAYLPNELDFTSVKQ
jgi:hypothetical protein